MQITTWNCCRGRPEVKLPHLLKSNPDVVAIQEVATPAGLLGETQAWHGDNLHQGLLALTYNGFRLEPVRRRRILAKFFFPMRVTGVAEFNLLMIWVKPLIRTGSYMDALFHGVTAYRDFI